ncbi:MAG: hypothetical protein EON59_07440 [Alphaproteobacteria bacterium]|nr:MAG: hypothetical protein EON59_07440 [Alphaproteobacteria bacterium]
MYPQNPVEILLDEGLGDTRHVKEFLGERILGRSGAERVNVSRLHFVEDGESRVGNGEAPAIRSQRRLALVTGVGHGHNAAARGEDILNA